MALLGLLALGDAHSLRLMMNSLLLAAAVSALAIPVGYSLAVMLNRYEVTGSGYAKFFVRMLIFIPLYLQVACWRSLLGPQGWLQSQAGEYAQWVLLDGWFGAIVLHALAAIPWVFLFTELALANIPAEFEEEGLLNASPLRVLFGITLRQSIGAVFVSALWILIICYGQMTVTSICNIRTYAEVLFTGITLGELNGEKQLGIWPGVMLIAVLISIAMLLGSQLIPQATHAETGRRTQFHSLNKSWIVSCLAWFFVLFLIGVPLIGLLYKAGVTVDRVGQGWERGWSLLKVSEIVVQSFREYRSDFIWSFLLGISCALITTSLALPLAWTARLGGKAAAASLGICAVLFALPGPLIGLSIIQVINQDESSFITYLYDQTILAPLIAVVIVSLPICIFFAWYRFRGDSSDLTDSASTEGAGYLQTFFLAGLTRHKSLVVATFLIAFSIAIADVGASFLVVPPGIDTVARKIFGLLHYGAEDNVAGICLVNLAFMAGMAVVVQRLLKEKQ